LVVQSLCILLGVSSTLIILKPVRLSVLVVQSVLVARPCSEA